MTQAPCDGDAERASAGGWGPSRRWRRGAGPAVVGDHPSEEYVVPFMNVKLVEEVFTEKQKYEMAAKLTDVMVAFEGSDAFREVVLVLMEELDRDGWQVGSIENARAAVAAGCEL